MPPQTLGQARVVDPVLSTVARSYRNGMFASMYLFPIAPVIQRGGKIITFGAEDFLQLNLERAPGANRERLNVGYSGDDYVLVQRALDGKVTIEQMQEANVVPGINLQRRAVRQTMNVVFLQIEVKAAALATTAASYSATHRATLAGANQWDHADSKPAARVEAAKEVIATSIGMDPNMLTVGPAVHRALRNNPDVVDRIKHTHAPGDRGNAPIVDNAALASYFGVEHYMVARARTGKPGAFNPLWGKNAVLTYSGVSTLDAAEGDAGEPSFGYTYRLMDYPMVEPGWYDKLCDSWIFPVTTEDTPVIAGKDAGYLFSAAVS